MTTQHAVVGRLLPKAVRRWPVIVSTSRRALKKKWKWETTKLQNRRTEPREKNPHQQGPPVPRKIPQTKDKHVPSDFKSWTIKDSTSTTWPFEWCRTRHTTILSYRRPLRWHACPLLPSIYIHEHQFIHSWIIERSMMNDIQKYTTPLWEWIHSTETY